MEIVPDSIAYKPRKVALGIKLLSTSIVVGIVNSVSSELIIGNGNYSTVRGFLTTTTTFGLMAFLIYRMNQRKNWARIAFSVLFLLGALPYLFLFAEIFKSSQVSGFLSAIITIIQIVALTLLYSEESNRWFKLK